MVSLVISDLLESNFPLLKGWTERTWLHKQLQQLLDYHSSYYHCCSSWFVSLTRKFFEGNSSSLWLIGFVAYRLVDSLMSKKKQKEEKARLRKKKIERQASPQPSPGKNKKKWLRFGTFILFLFYHSEKFYLNDKIYMHSLYDGNRSSSLYDNICFFGLQ